MKMITNRTTKPSKTRRKGRLLGLGVCAEDGRTGAACVAG
jgi:hypothetical protein